MQARARIQEFFKALQSNYSNNRNLILLSFFLIIVILISLVIPMIYFGRFFGTDDYTHLFHTKEMASTFGLVEFYEKIGNYVSNPGSGENLYNYPFGLWLFGATIAKITALPLLSAEFFFVILFLLILVSSFYLYSSTFLESKEQQIVAVLFLLSMPNASLTLLEYWPTTFTLPFLFILLYIALKDPVQWKLFPIVWLSIFIITIGHTGTFIFLIIFSMFYFLLYCILWGRFSYSMFTVTLSTFVIYVFSLTWFPQFSNQYEVKSHLFLTPGTFFASRFNFNLPLELGNIFYQNMLVNQEFIYTIILGAFIFSLGKLFVYIHLKISEKFIQPGNLFPITLPISNISHSVVATPVWIGPIHLLLSIIGFFKIDSRGKCILISTFLITVTPDLLLTAQGTEAQTGALREIAYLTIIIPITSVLGLWALISYLDSIKHTQKNLFTLMVWILVLLVIIITPIMATTYYLPKIAGEDYIIDGMRWLSESGNTEEKVVGYGYRTVPIFTNMTDAAYGLENGYDTNTFVKLLKGIYFSKAGNDAGDLRQYYGVKYVLTSDKLAANLGNSPDRMLIDGNQALDKIYSSKDFGVYEISTSSEKMAEKKFLAENISLQEIGSSLQIETDVYKVILNENYPVIEQFGSPRDNYLGGGFFNDNIQISGIRQQSYANPFIPPDESAIRQNSTVDLFSLKQVSASPTINKNQIIYETILKDQQNGENEASLRVIYTFFPTTVKREFLISNDWVTVPQARYMNVRFSTSFFVPLNNFVLKSNQSRIERHIYPSLDSVVKNEKIRDFYIHEGDRGIYIKNEPTSSYPFELSYAGSTLYNMSSIGFSQSESLKPGATLHITQYLAPGDEVTAENNILTQEGITLLDYPNGLVPIILSGYRTPLSDIGYSDKIEQGYKVLSDEDVPYTEAIVPEQFTEIPSIESSSQLYNVSKVIHRIDFQTIPTTSIKIIGSGTMGSTYFDNFTEQEQSISSTKNYANLENVTLIGYMPGSLDYNLDTLKIISDKKIPFLLSKFVSPPYYSMSGLQNQNPQMAFLQSESADVVLLPVSLPLSSALSSQSNRSDILSAWQATIDEAAVNDRMTFFIISAADIGNPKYTEDIKSLIVYARNRGLTFTTPDVMVNHFKKIQNIQYIGSINGDIATINLTNNNDDVVQGVTFRIVLPALKTGGYQLNDGTITKTKTDKNHIIVYVSTDISAHATKEIKIIPQAPKEKIVVTMPQRLVEGVITISLKDTNGNPLPNADIIIDSKYYSPDAKGNINIKLMRGVHNVQILSPGFEPYDTILNVKGRIYMIEQFLKRSA
jgi:hypothetical protein